VTAAPILPWAGSKRRLLPELLARMPESYEGYYEPFFGGGSLFFEVLPAWSILGDLNTDLMQAYRALADDSVMVIDLLGQHAWQHSEEYYLGVRRRWNEQRAETGGSIFHAVRAADFIYLARKCFNGLWRVNKDGEFNVPMGNNKRPVCDREALVAASEALQGSHIRDGAWSQTCNDADAGDFVYFDPPFDGTFTGYTADGFNEDAQRALARGVHDLVAKGVRVMLSNADTPLIRELYADYRIDRVTCGRTNGGKGAKREPAYEVIVCCGYEPPTKTTETKGTKKIMARTDQLEIRGTEDKENPEIKEKINAWLDAKDAQADAGQKTKKRHAEVILAIQSAGLDRYPFIDPKTGKRKYAMVANEFKVSTGPAPAEKKGRRTNSDARLSGADDAHEATDTERLERQAKREPADPFASTRSSMHKDDN
jgi:DNA adenine methylase